MTRIKPQFQPPGSPLCGQTCVAMILDIPLTDAVKAVGKASGTTGPDLARALTKMGIGCSPCMVRLSKKRRIHRKAFDFSRLPRRCIAKVRAEGIRKSHWILVWDREKYDPYPGYVPWKYVSGYIWIRETL